MEYYSKCNVCGKIYCYTDRDISQNKREASVAGLAAVSSIANAIGGTRYDMYESNKIADRASDRVVDYSKCPHCHSTDTELVTKKFAIFSNKVNGNYSIDDLIKAANDFLKKGDTENVLCFSNAALNEDENNYEAHLVRFLGAYGFKSIDDMDKSDVDFSNSISFSNLLNCASKEDKEVLLEKFNESKRRKILTDAKELVKTADDYSKVEEIKKSIKLLEKNDLVSKNQKLYDSLIEKRDNLTYDKAVQCSKMNDVDSLTLAVSLFEEVIEVKDAKDLLDKTNKKLDEVKKKLKVKQAKRKKTIKKILLISSAVVGVIVLVLLVIKLIIPGIIYAQAEKCYDNEDYVCAMNKYRKAGDFKDANSMEKEAKMLRAIQLSEEGKFDEAYALSWSLSPSKFKEKKKQIDYNFGISNLEKNPLKAYEALEKIGNFKDAKEQAEKAAINYAIQLEKAEQMDEAFDWYKKGDFGNTGLSKVYEYVKSHFEAKNKMTFKCINILMANGHKEGKVLYDQLYSPSYEIFINYDKESNVPATVFDSNQKSLYIHYKLNGLTPIDGRRFLFKCPYIISDTKTSTKNLVITIDPTKIGEWGTLEAEVLGGHEVKCSIHTDDGKTLFAESNILK